MSTNLTNKVYREVTAEAEIKWTAKMIEEYFLEVISTLKKLPPVKQRGYFSLWPDIIYSSNEIVFQEKKPIYLQASSEAIARFEKTFEWMLWLTVEERKLIWKRAVRAKWKLIAWELGCEVITARTKWLKALNKIAGHLNSKTSKYDTI